MRSDVTGPLSQAEIDAAQNKTLPAIDKCRRNVQLSPFGNNATDAFGSICGGNAAHPKQQGVVC
jgi:hypothetical protein